MKVTSSLFYLLAFSFFFCSCANNGKNSNKSDEDNQPVFADNGKTIDSLKQVYNCESINYENWADKKTTDSCLTVCLINSTKVPSGSNVEEDADRFKAIAISIKKSLAKPETYKSFYIIFVKKENNNGLKTKVHSAGMELPSAEL
jgi:hypothetical protein